MQAIIFAFFVNGGRQDGTSKSLCKLLAFQASQLLFSKISEHFFGRVPDLRSLCRMWWACRCATPAAAPAHMCITCPHVSCTGDPSS